MIYLYLTFICSFIVVLLLTALDRLNSKHEIKPDESDDELELLEQENRILKLRIEVLEAVISRMAIVQKVGGE